MYQEQVISGSLMEDRTLCLTFDDGPGPHTLEIAEYLTNQGIFATFFMAGKFASSLPDIPARVRDLGHLIGNHTYDHPDLIGLLSGGGDVASQITRTDLVIGNCVDGSTTYFRPPYGRWNVDVASVLNANPAASFGHVGPIHWDIENDWWFWQQHLSPRDCMENYMQQLSTKGRGIVLMHDNSADSCDQRDANRTLDLARLLVPVLRGQGFRFLRLDAIPGIDTGGANEGQSPIPPADLTRPPASPRIQPHPNLVLLGLLGCRAETIDGATAWRYLCETESYQHWSFCA